ncbi:uncharacterized protein LOC141639365 [Silene latifolia]|uniref:uncharacterized protein LOC141639365 n=1 Tax=Silene latifolia TaxID=37657 RepID=UPI003D78488B
MKDILAIPIRCSEGSDNFFWSASSSGDYSLKIGYHIALKNSWNTSATPKDLSRVPAACMGVFQKILWNLPGPKSWIILIWKTLTETLPCGEGFLKRGFDGPFTCVLCDSQETERLIIFSVIVHLLVEFGLEADNKQEVCLSFLCTFWTIWVVRCRKVFDNSECSPIGAILLYQDSLKWALWAEDKKSESITFQTPLEEELTNLRNGVIFPLIQGSLNCSQSHIYVDAAWSKELVAGLGGCIMFDNEVVSDSYQRKSLRIFEQVLAQVLKCSQLKHWIRNTVEDITDLAANFHCVSFAYVRRICNKAVHRLAKRVAKL